MTISQILPVGVYSGNSVAISLDKNPFDHQKSNYVD